MLLWAGNAAFGKAAMSAILIFASARSQGNTRKAVNNLLNNINFSMEFIDLSSFNVQPFSYDFDQEDDFPSLIKRVASFELIVLATPVYWYGVSAQMKCFLDRFSDLLIIDKPLGRQFRGKRVAVITSYQSYPGGAEGFEAPLINMADYLGMQYLGTYFHYSGGRPDGVVESQASLVRFLEALSR